MVCADRPVVACSLLIQSNHLAAAAAAAGRYKHKVTGYLVFMFCFLSPSAGKTRTKEKYRVVYTDHQRLELEKEFHFNRYITIRRKSELAVNLGLSERQV